MNRGVGFADDDAGQIDQLLHQPCTVGWCVCEFLFFARGVVLADEENQFLCTDINSGEEWFWIFEQFFRLNGHDVYP